MSNAYVKLLALLPKVPRMYGEVISGSDDAWRVRTPGGSIYICVGKSQVGAFVYFRGSVIEGPAPSLPYFPIMV